ncbi:uncharacterized protein NPIL_246701 [Nephila pilipes]|uniref:Uncharacterized protein n=1 Tax=Nephila pilipes TaxID=299642 RepID=A0A8X6TWC7_NEPPI|nr:uncharacterized protein NPIL_246701 [Nephila pilipes]
MTRFRRRNEELWNLKEVRGFSYDPLTDALAIKSFTHSDILAPASPSVKKVEAFLLGPSAISFVEVFTRAIKSSNLLTDVFDFSEMTGLQFYQFHYRNFFFQLLRYKSPFAEVAADMCTLPIAQNFPNLSFQIMVDVYGYIMARFLLSEKILNHLNAETLALDYVKSFMDAAELISSSESNYKLRVLLRGFLSFTISHVEMTPKKGWRLATYCGVTWMLNAALNGHGVGNDHPTSALERAHFISDDILPPELPSEKTVEAFLLGPIANAFVEVFTQKIKSSNTLIHVFDLSQTTGPQYNDFLYKSCLELLKRYKAPFAEVAARLGTLPVAQNFHHLSLQIVVNVYGYSVARFLLSEKMLNQSNAESLALAYAKAFEDNVELIPKTRPDYKLWVLSKGFGNFTTTQVAMTPVKGWRLAIYCGVTWMMNAVLYGTWSFSR